MTAFPAARPVSVEAAHLRGSQRHDLQHLATLDVADVHDKGADGASRQYTRLSWVR